MKHGLYSKYKATDPAFAEAYKVFLKQFEQDPMSLKNLTGEIALIKGFLQTIMDKAPGLDQKFIDFVTQTVLKLSWIIEKHVKINEGETVNVKHYQVIFVTTINAVLDLTKEYITDEDKYQEFLGRLDDATSGFSSATDSVAEESVLESGNGPSES